MDKNTDAFSGRLGSIVGALLLAWMFVVLTATDAQAAPLVQTDFDCSPLSETSTAECVSVAQSSWGRVDHLLSVDQVRVFYSPIPTLLSPFGVVEVRVTLTNKDEDFSIYGPPYFQVRGLNGNLLLNAANGPAGDGAILPIFAEDGVLVSTERTKVSFYIGLWQLRTIALDVAAFGIADDGDDLASRSGEESPLHIVVTLEDLEAARQDGRLYLPHLHN